MFNKNDTKNGSRDALCVGARMRGVTLVETLVAFAIVSVTFVIVLDAFLTANRATQAAERRAAVADALSHALADMAREAQVSGDFEVYNVAGTWTWKMKRKKQLQGIESADVTYTLSTSKFTKKVGMADETRLTPPDVKLKRVTLTDAQLPLSTSPHRVIVNMGARHSLDEDRPSNQVVVQAQFVERDE